jgi:hypothetical protein
VPTDASWVGLSEVTVTGDDLVLIERDNRTGDFAANRCPCNIPVSAR